MNNYDRVLNISKSSSTICVITTSSLLLTLTSGLLVFELDENGIIQCIFLYVWFLQVNMNCEIHLCCSRSLLLVNFQCFMIYYWISISLFIHSTVNRYSEHLDGFHFRLIYYKIRFCGHHLMLCLLKLFPIFILNCLIVFLLVYRTVLYNMGITSPLVICCRQLSFYCLFLNGAFQRTEVCNFNVIECLDLFFYEQHFFFLRNIFLPQSHEDILLEDYLLETDLPFTFRSVILKLIFVYGVRQESDSVFFSPYGYTHPGHFFKTLSFPLCCAISVILVSYVFMYMWIPHCP